MSQDTLNTVLIFLGGLLVAVLYVLDRSGKRLSTSIPSELLPVIMGLLALAETLAKETPTTADDDLIKQIKEALQQTAASLPEPSPFTTPEELAARLDPQAQG